MIDILIRKEDLKAPSSITAGELLKDLNSNIEKLTIDLKTRSEEAELASNSINELNSKLEVIDDFHTNLEKLTNDVDGYDITIKLIFESLAELSGELKYTKASHSSKIATLMNDFEDTVEHIKKQVSDYDVNLGSFVKLLTSVQAKLKRVEELIEITQTAFIEMESKLDTDVVTRKSIESAIRKEGVIELASIFSALGHPSLEDKVSGDGLIYYDCANKRLRLCVDNVWKTIKTENG